MSPSEVWVLLEREDAFQARRFTVEESGELDYGIHLSEDADPRQLSLAGGDVWAGGGPSGRSYPAMLSEQPQNDPDEQREKSLAGFPLGAAVVTVKEVKEDAATIRVSLSGMKSSFRLVPPSGYSLRDVGVVGWPAPRGIHLYAVVRSAAEDFGEYLSFVEVSSDGGKLAQAVLAASLDEALGVQDLVRGIDVDEAGRIYLLKWLPELGSPPGSNLEVTVFPPLRSTVEATGGTAISTPTSASELVERAQAALDSLGPVHITVTETSQGKFYSKPSRRAHSKKYSPLHGNQACVSANASTKSDAARSSRCPHLYPRTTSHKEPCTRTPRARPWFTAALSSTIAVAPFSSAQVSTEASPMFLWPEPSRRAYSLKTRSSGKPSPRGTTSSQGVSKATAIAGCRSAPSRSSSTTA